MEDLPLQTRTPSDQPSRDPAFSRPEPAEGVGVLPPLNSVEAGFNKLTAALPIFAAALLFLVALLVTCDALGRSMFSMPLRGLADWVVLLMVFIGYSCLAYPIMLRQNLQIDLVYDMLSPARKRLWNMAGHLLSCGVAGALGYFAVEASFTWDRVSAVVEIPEWIGILATGIGLLLAAAAFFFQFCQAARSMVARKEYTAIATAVCLVLLVCSLPFLYKFSGLKLSGLILGGIGFSILMALMMMRAPLGYLMAIIGLLGLLAVSRTSSAALNSVALVPFSLTNNMAILAFPMFLLMGELVAASGMSGDLFDAAKKWLGRLPGGLAVATVGGCAGFAAVCGESLATVVTMNAVAMPAMKESGYHPRLSTGALASGGTLGILIPPSMGFIVYSMITEESVGKLFVAGILPGLLLGAIFIGIVILLSLRHPEWAPKSPSYSSKEKWASLVYLVPIVILFLVVVLGILYGWFTPAEGGAVGAVMAGVYALARGKLKWKSFSMTMYRTTGMLGKMWALFVGLHILGAFLAISRLPYLLSSLVVSLDVNRYLILLAVVLLFIFLGCIMNIMPMMMLTLPSIYPTVHALGFDGIWFGVLCVIVMEMGMITPPVGMNVFTLSGLQPDISMATMFKGVMPFFLGMLLCALLVVIFPSLALFLIQ